MRLDEIDRHRDTVATAAGPLSYLAVGTGPPAVFVHGVGTNAYLWRHVMADLQDVRRCIALDLPLHGRSPARADQDFSLPGLARVLGEFCDALGLDEVDLVANDTGGAVAQVYAVQNADRLRTLTLTNCDTHDNLPPEPFEPTVELARRGELAPLGMQLAANPRLARSGGTFAESFEAPERLSDEEVHAYLDPVFGTVESARQFERLLTSLRASDLIAIEDKLWTLSMPTALIWGTADKNFPLSAAEWLLDRIPGATEIVPVDGGHLFFPTERPTELATPLRQLWNVA